MRGNGGIIGKPNTTTIEVASGIWSLREATSYKRNDIWPAMDGHTFVDSSTSTDSEDITIPSAASAGDIAVLFDSTATGTLATPSGWTNIYQQNATFETSVSYKILAGGDPGTSITGITDTVYSIKTMLVFRPVPGKSITSVSVNSFNTSGETSNQPGSQ